MSPTLTASDSLIAPAPAPSRTTTLLDRVIVDGLIVDAFVGIEDAERLQRQRVRFDVEIAVVADYAEIVRSTGRYVSYADIVRFVEARAALDDHVELVETWAEDVAAFALENELVETVRVTVRKPDIFERAAGVGISIERRRARPTVESAL